MTAYETTLAETFAGREPGPDRGEPAGAHPRQPADGAVEQVRLARARDRQQVGDVGRLLDPLRRPRRRLRRHQGLPQDARLRADPPPQRGRAGDDRQRADPVRDHRPRAERRAAARPEGRGLAPPYAVLDPILDGYVEQDLGRAQLIQRGFDADDVDHVIKLVDRAEYKRRQAPPGIKITGRAFGRDRRVPITNRYRG